MKKIYVSIGIAATTEQKLCVEYYGDVCGGRLVLRLYSLHLTSF